MRIAGQEKIKKSWCIKLIVERPNIYLAAVDLHTEDLIVRIIVFIDNGHVDRLCNVRQRLEDAGYDPHEHNNTFDGEGRIEMDVV